MDPFPALPIPTFELACVAALWLAWMLYLRRWRAMKLVTVIDGDTYVGVDSRGKRHRLRLALVDCPEMQQRNGPLAKHFVHRTVGRQWVQVRLIGRDRYRRKLAVIRVEGEDLARLLVSAGLAHPLTSHFGLRMAARGAWIARKGVHAGFGQARPWHWRSRNALGRTLHYWAQRLQRSRRRR